MAIIVEDGTAKVDAESYATVEQVDTYQSTRGVTLWATLSTNEKEQALRRATSYMSQAYRLRWQGCRATTTQALDWPRDLVPRVDYYAGAGFGYGSDLNFYAADTVPTEVVQACCIAAFKAAFGDLAPDIEPLAIREKVGPIEVERAPGSLRVVRYQALDNILAPLIKHGGGSLMVMRA